MYDTTPGWEYLIKNFNKISTEIIADKALLRLDIYILTMRYLEKGALCFTKVTQNDKESNKEAKTV